MDPMTPAPDQHPADPAADLAALLASRGVDRAAAVDAVRELRILAESDVPASIIARAVAIMPAASVEAAAPGVLARAQAWVRSLSAAIDRAASDAIGALQPMPQVAGVRRAVDADRFRIEGGRADLQLGLEGERLPAGAGWRLVGMLTASGGVPAGIELCFVDHAGREHVTAVDDLAMVECTLPDGAYACSVRAGGISSPTIVEFTVP